MPPRRSNAPGSILTHNTFEATSWHDNWLHGLSIVIGDIANNDWRSELVLDIDYIADWLCDNDGSCQFQVAPATLIFHSVTDLKIDIAWPDSGFQTSYPQPAIDTIEREQIADQKVCLDRPYYHWRLAFNSPAGASIDFGASGYTQTLRSPPVLQSDQGLLSTTRTPILQNG